MASLSLNNTAKAILLALLSTGLLAACGGGGGGTTRGSDSGGETPTPETTYKLTISSPVPLKNAVVRVITLANKEVGKGTITNGSTISFNIKATDANQILIAELSPKDNSSVYYDVTLNKFASFNTTLHRVFIMQLAAAIPTVDPFSEIVYQRALVRAGSMDQNAPAIDKISFTDIYNSQSELTATFGVVLGVQLANINPEMITMNKRSDYAKLIYSDNDNNNKQQYENAFFAVGHFLVQHENNPADSTPYLTFAKKAAEDMRDGSLDGLTIFGDGTDAKNNSYTLKDAIIEPAPLNTDPALNKIVAYDEKDPDKNNRGTMKGTQKNVRVTYANALRSNLLTFMNSLASSGDDEGIKSFTGFLYAEGIGGYEGKLTRIPFGLHSFGAGNYKRAFGIEPVTIAKGTEQFIRDKNCVGDYVKAPSDKDLPPVLPGCILGVNVEGEEAVAPYNAIQALVGKYTSTDSCKLTISYNGRVRLSKGSQIFNSTVDHGEFDALIHTGVSADDHSYILNVASANTDPVEIIQLKVVEQKVVSATAGSDSTDYPKVLDNPKLSCTFQYD